MQRLLPALYLFPCLLALAMPVQAETFRVQSADELAMACVLAGPGDRILLQDGSYSNQHFIFAASGSPRYPITLQAENPGKVILNGESRLSIGGQFLIVDGLLFCGGALSSDSIIEFKTPDDTVARHCIIRNTAIQDYNPADSETRYFWVSLFGSDNIVENCAFEGQAHSGVTVCVRLGGDDPGRHTIRANYFGPRPAGSGNGFETIRIGTGGNRDVSAQCIVEDNLFEACNGETEIVSNKSCDNVFRGNTFLRCVGTLTLRQGHRATIERNVFLGEGVSGTGGLRVTGSDHRIIENFFSGTTGRAGGAISLRAGTPGAPRGDYPPIVNTLIDGNTFVDNSGPAFALDAGYERDGDHMLPEATTISNTLIVSAEAGNRIINADIATPGIEWINNLLVDADPREELPRGITVFQAVPGKWKARLNPVVLKRKDVGPAWILP